MPCLLVENKIDLLDDPINQQELDKFAVDNQFIGAFATSAKTGVNVNEAMEGLITNIINRMEAMSNSQEPGKVFSTERNVVKLDKDEHQTLTIKKRKKNCC